MANFLQVLEVRYFQSRCFALSLSQTSWITWWISCTLLSNTIRDNILEKSCKYLFSYAFLVTCLSCPPNLFFATYPSGMNKGCTDFQKKNEMADHFSPHSQSGHDAKQQGSVLSLNLKHENLWTSCLLLGQEMVFVVLIKSTQHESPEDQWKRLRVI